MEPSQNETPSKPEGPGISTPFEEALVATENGRYNYMLATTCSYILLAISVDMFGFTLVVAAACDLDLNINRKTIILSAPFIGIFLTSYMWGYIADTRGRRYTLVRAITIGFIISVLGSLSTDWIMLGFLKFLAVSVYCAANSSAYTIVGESCMASVRSRYTLLMSCLLILSPAIGAALSYPTLYYSFSFTIPILGIHFRPWRLLLIVLALPLGSGGILIYFFSESPKFLANWNRKSEALMVLKRIHAINTRGKKGPYPITSIFLEDERAHTKLTFCRKIYEQGAPLFKKPLLRRTAQLFYLMSVVYMTNNSLIVWLPVIMTSIRTAMECKACPWSDICTMLNFSGDQKEFVCKERVENLALITLICSQSTYGVFNLIVSTFPHKRRFMLTLILVLSGLSTVLVPVVPEPISSTVFFVVVTGTCLGMGILASYFIDYYPTSYRGMVQCLSIMVGRSSTFTGINIVGMTIFTNCRLTFWFFTVFVFSGAIVAYFLPNDKPPERSTTQAPRPPSN